MQLLCKSSVENGYNKGLGHLNLKVIKLKKINTGWRKTLYTQLILKVLLKIIFILIIHTTLNLILINILHVKCKIQKLLHL